MSTKQKALKIYKLISLDIMDSSSVRFGTSGLRGLVKDLTKDVCFRFTQAFIFR